MTQVILHTINDFISELEYMVRSGDIDGDKPLFLASLTGDAVGTVGAGVAVSIEENMIGMSRGMGWIVIDPKDKDLYERSKYVTVLHEWSTAE